MKEHKKTPRKVAHAIQIFYFSTQIRIVMKIAIAIDSFKGSLSSKDAEKAVEEAIHTIMPECETTCIPIADGGEGTLSVIMEITGATLHTVHAHNPCMEIIPAQYGISTDGETAFIEMAAISGLPLIQKEQQNPMETTTFGTGELILDALQKGCTRFIVGIGGSATNDAGTGMLQALGFKFLNHEGKPLKQGGKILIDIESIDHSEVSPLLKNALFIVGCDVRNPFYGPEGSAFVYARQKGADDSMIIELDKGLQSFANVIKRETGKDISQIPGSGAAGGLGGGMLAFLNAELKSGADLLLESCHFEEKISNTDLIITGEGRIDRQSLMGKIPGKILQIAHKHHIPVIAISGIAKDWNLLKQAGFKGIYTTKPDSMTIEEAMKPGIAKQNLKNTVLSIFSQPANFD